MARRQEEQTGGAPLMAEGKADAEVRLILYHWTHSFSSQKVRLVIAEKALKCEEHDLLTSSIYTYWCQRWRTQQSWLP
uniref:Ganglioside induced differentiation associated protein 1 n=2 Tax=Canis lupus familiaris TaxID=9615 RepID=A0A8P0PMI1_CANLF